MANAYAINFSYQSSSNTFSGIWKLSRVMKAAGWTVPVSSNGTTKSIGVDYWGSGADPLTDSYPTSVDSTASWIVMRGPSTIKLSFTSAPGNLLRGESVTQATSGATGELLGLVWDSASTAGWAVIMPRTGTFNGSNVVTGAISSATFTPTAYKEYVREVVFAKSSSNTTQGTIYYICADVSGESASLFSSLSSTASVFPGGGGAGNTFPSIAMCVKGAAGSVSHVNWTTSSSLASLGQTACVNATPSAGVSADGSFYLIYNFTNNATPQIIGFSRCYDTEPADIDPYVFISPGTATVASYTNSTSVTAPTTALSYSNWLQLSGSTSAFYFGYVSRGGEPARDKGALYLDGLSASGNPLAFYTNVHLRCANFPGASSNCPPIRYNAHLYAPRTTEIFYKGRPKWFFLVGSGNKFETLDSKSYFIIVSKDTASGNPAIAVGPLDGSTTPTCS